ncbi:MAG TPA: hypothetical protein VMT33_05280 [Candidatus Bathyarchaeia archaeon]|jgi:hypothetical protein|nr:hypothetical protein [Candidatus Bathyarchaeia archaeon]
MNDTSPEAEALQDELIQAMSPAERMRRVLELNRAVETIAIAGIRSLYPNASPREVFLRLAERKLGRELARRVYPELEALEA